MTAKGRLLPNGAGWRCRECGRIVLAHPSERTATANYRLCQVCVEAARAARRKERTDE